MKPGRARRALTFGIGVAGMTGAAAVVGSLCPGSCPNCSQCLAMLPTAASAVAVAGGIGAARLLRRKSRRDDAPQAVGPGG